MINNKKFPIRKLGEICEIIGGGTPSKSNCDFYTGDIPWATVRDMRGDIISDTEFKITEAAVKNSSANVIPKNNVVIATRVGLGRICFLKYDTAINQDLRGIVPKNIKQLSVRYLFWWLKSISSVIIANGAGATVQGVKLPFVKNLEIPTPVLHEQLRIVTILHKAFSTIDKAKSNAEQNLKNAKVLFENYLRNAFENKGEDWEEKTLKDVCEISSKLIDPKNSEFQDMIHIGAGNIESKKGTLMDLKTAKEENLISGKFLFDESMVLYSKIRPYLMKVVHCEFQGLCSADIYPLRPFKEKMTKDFLYHLLLTKDFTEYAIIGSQRAGMPKVNREHLFEYKFYLPPLNTQHMVVQKINTLSAETNKLEKLYQTKIHKLNELKTSILQKAFNGELIVEDMNLNTKVQHERSGY